MLLNPERDLGRPLVEVREAAARKLKRRFAVASAQEVHDAIDATIPDLLWKWPEYESSLSGTAERNFNFAVDHVYKRALRPLKRLIHDRQHTIGVATEDDWAMYERRLAGEAGFEDSLIDRLEREYHKGLVTELMEVVLSASERSVLHALFWSELTYATAANRLNITANDVRRLRQSGLRRLKRALEKILGPSARNSVRRREQVCKRTSSRDATTQTASPRGSKARTERADAPSLLDWLGGIANSAPSPSGRRSERLRTPA